MKRFKQITLLIIRPLPPEVTDIIGYKEAILNSTFDAIQRNKRKLEFKSSRNKRIRIGHSSLIDASQGYAIKKRKREEEEVKATNSSTTSEKAPSTAITNDPNALILEFNSDDDYNSNNNIEIPQFDQIQEELATQEGEELATQEGEETSSNSSAFDTSQSDFILFT
ncbi:uncharacterized protein RSE6_01313 [Rhynchosporium secalis]|uniref:Uncharacterized protein n=1 Tax=Rhynchosporium secalis TaxID=38038 RepID=A0A1E1LXI6_RHYSE|nr:uncharacterized protein RSE6_01313 [Rhynchosporium secalis]